MATPKQKKERKKEKEKKKEKKREEMEWIRALNEP